MQVKMSKYKLRKFALKSLISPKNSVDYIQYNFNFNYFSLSFFLKNKRRLRLKRTEPSYNVDNETLQNLHLLKIDPHTEKLLRLKRRRRQQKQTKQGTRVAARRLSSKTNLDKRRQSENTQRATRLARFHLWFYRVVTHDRFEWAVIALILVNAAVLACYHYPMDPKLKNVLEILNLVSI